MAQLEDYRAFFRTHEVSGTPARKPDLRPYERRVPLNAIIAAVDAVKEFGPLNDQQRSFLRLIHDTARGLLAKL